VTGLGAAAHLGAVVVVLPPARAGLAASAEIASAPTASSWTFLYIRVDMGIPPFLLSTVILLE